MVVQSAGQPLASSFSLSHLRIEAGLEVQVGDEGDHACIVLLEPSSIAFPDFDEPVPEGEQEVPFEVNEGMDIVQGAVE